MPADSKIPNPPAAVSLRAPAQARRDRLARALRDNLKKRKAQQRQREQPSEAAPGAPVSPDRCGDDNSGGGA